VEPEVKLEEDLQPVIERSVDSETDPAQTDVQAEPGTESGELEVTIEGDSPPPVDQDSSVIREMRKALREAEKERKRLREELEAKTNPKQELGPKPTLDDPAIDYDADKYDAALLAWSERKRQVESEAAKQQEAQKAEQQVFAERLDRYNAEKRSLKIAGYDDAESTVTETLNTTQQSVLIRYFDKPALIVAAIGSSPETAKRLSAIKDPIEFAFAVRDLEAKVKTTPRKPPAPESALTSSRGVSSASREQQLLDAAIKSGDYTQIHKYRMEQRKRS
jgi:hypothetical protein